MVFNYQLHKVQQMIHYHGSPLSGPGLGKERFYAGRHALVSYAYKGDLAIVAESCQSFIFDNGAFTAWKQGKPLDIPSYVAWVTDWYKHPGFDWALVPDVIDGDEDANDRLLADWPTQLPGVPVWHMHESFERLERLVNTYKTVALGSSGEYSSPNSKVWWVRMAAALDAVCDSSGRPPCKLHGLRMLNPAVFSRMPLSSADSTNATVNAGSKDRFGIYLPVTAAARANVIADRVEAWQSAPVWGGLGVQAFEEEYKILEKL